MTEIIPVLSVRGVLVIIGVGGEPIQVSAVDMIPTNRRIQGHASGAAMDSEDTLSGFDVFEMVKKERAELSSQTFWCFAREFSSSGPQPAITSGIGGFALSGDEQRSDSGHCSALACDRSRSGLALALSRARMRSPCQQLKITRPR
jgi:hypothetical protein